MCFKIHVRSTISYELLRNAAAAGRAPAIRQQSSIAVMSAVGFLLENPETHFQNGFSEEKVRNVQKKFLSYLFQTERASSS